MPPRSSLSENFNRFLDRIIGRISGQAPTAALEGQPAWRLTVTVGLIALGLSGWLVWRGIQATVPRVVVSNTNQTTPIAELEKLKSKDTDEDGLSNYDELFSLQTSPYLQDSDSDGLSDGQEVSSNTNPNCPTGQACGQVEAPAGSTEGELSPTFLRQALRASGVPQATLASLTDEDVVQLYKDVTAVSGANTNGASNTNSVLSAPTLASLAEMTPTEIRKLLVESGIEASSLENVDDATLKEIFLEAINSETQ